jgi:hypothetical protein
MNPTASDAANWLARLYTIAGRFADARAVTEAVVLRDPA